jgi:hypothetical protein
MLCSIRLVGIVGAHTIRSTPQGYMALSLSPLTKKRRDNKINKKDGKQINHY